MEYRQRDVVSDDVVMLDYTNTLTGGKRLRISDPMVSHMGSTSSAWDETTLNPYLHKEVLGMY